MKRGKKIVATLCSTALVATMFMMAGCGNESKPSADNSAANGDKPSAQKYIIATDTTFAPFEFENAQGEYVGIDVDILAAVAADQGFEYELQPLGFDAALQSLTSGQADGVIAGMSITEEREKIFDFSAPYFDSGVVMGISATDDTIKSYSDLTGKTVAVKNGTEGEAFAQSIAEQYGFTLVNFKDSAMMYEDVKAGNSQACFEDYPVLGYAITQNVGLQIVTDKERGSSYGFAVKKGENAELLAAFDAGLANIKANGTYQAILDTYIQK
ncbi:MAG: transporter substrate-binding domain-containing protein [Coriobacteriales bacterium]|jgi:polar amino acid transport system substrate-binding protein|nr:transporter substrate-binding domain-containing protein [Coriobacteriales bacterium]